MVPTRILAALLIVTIVSSKLVYLAQIFRHGARYPVLDIYDGKDTKPWHGMLTAVGMRQHYLLGSYLRKDYLNNLGLSPSFDCSEVEVFSYSSQRCVQSAYAHMAGWFPLGSGQQIPAGLDPSFLEPPFSLSNNLNQAQALEEPALTEGYQPIPIKIGKTFFPDCPLQPYMQAQRVQVIAGKVALLEVQQTQFILKMRSIFNLTVFQSNIVGMGQLYDTVVCDRNLGRKLPSQFTDQHFAQLKYIYSYVTSLLNAQHYAKVFSTPFMRPILDYLAMNIAGKYGNKKLTVFSAHDSNVLPILSFLNFTSGDCIQRKFRNQTVTGNCAEITPFACSIQFQLHLNDSASNPRDPASYFVKVKYDGDYYQLCGSTLTQCQYPKFATLVHNSLVDYNKECGLK